MARKSSNQRNDIEEYLVSRGVSFTFRGQVPTSKFNVEKSLRNQARLGTPLDDVTVKRYAEALYDGDVFPPLLVNETDDGEYVVLDGNHRLKAHIEASEKVDVYVCEAPPQTLVMLTFEANAKHGLPSSVDDRLHHALFLMDSGMSEKEAAARLGVPKTSLHRVAARHAGDRRADDVGVLRRDWEALTMGNRSRLQTINTDEGFAAAVKLAHDAGLTAEEVSEMVSGMNMSRSGKRQAAFVKSYRDSLAERIAEVSVTGAPQAGKGRPRTPQAQLAMAMGQVNHLPAPETFKELPETLRADYVKKVDEAAARLAAIRDALA